MSSRAVTCVHQPRFRRSHGQLCSAPRSRRRRRCRHPPSRTKSWAVAGPLHPCGRATGVQLRLQPGPDPHRQPGGAVRANDRDQRLHGRQPHRIRRRVPPAWRTAVGPSGGARGTSAASTIVRGRSWEIPTTPADASRPRRIVAGLGPGAGQKKQAGGRACCRTSPRRMVQPRRRPLAGRPRRRARTGCRAVAGQICIEALRRGVLKVAVEIVAMRGPAVGAGTGLQRP